MKKLLVTLRSHAIKAVGFITGKIVVTKGEAQKLFSVFTFLEQKPTLKQRHSL